jgi:DNA-binding transcriptional ArsR family regulator
MRTDDGAAEMARLAGALADHTRASFCLALLDGRAWTAGELARRAGVARSTASEHLDRLVVDGLVTEQRQGRHRYVRLADHEMAELVEYLSSRAPWPGPTPTSLRQATKHEALARARTCYDHLAGRLGVAITDAMVDRGLLAGWGLTARGTAWLAELGVDVGQPRASRRPLVRPCLDWTERRPHLAGAVGAALCRRCLEAHWIERIGSGRAVRLTSPGRQALSGSLEREF